MKMNGVTPTAIKVIFQSRKAETENPTIMIDNASIFIAIDSVVKPVSFGTCSLNKAASSLGVLSALSNQDICLYRIDSKSKHLVLKIIFSPKMRKHHFYKNPKKPLPMHRYKKYMHQVSLSDRNVAEPYSSLIT